MTDADDFAAAWRALSDAGVNIHPTETPTVAAGIQSLAARLAKAERENELLRQAFKEYGFHRVDCLYETDAFPCDCGYHDVKVQLQRPANSAPGK